jgi:hypothetical protein
MTKDEMTEPPAVDVSHKVLTEILRDLNESLVLADQNLRRGKFTAARQAIAMCGRPIAALAGLLLVDLDAP